MNQVSNTWRYCSSFNPQADWSNRELIKKGFRWVQLLQKQSDRAELTMFHYWTWLNVVWRASLVKDLQGWTINLYLVFCLPCLRVAKPQCSVQTAHFHLKPLSKIHFTVISIDCVIDFQRKIYFNRTLFIGYISCKRFVKESTLSTRHCI